MKSFSFSFSSEQLQITLLCATTEKANIFRQKILNDKPIISLAYFIISS